MQFKRWRGMNGDGLLLVESREPERVPVCATYTFVSTSTAEETMIGGEPVSNR